MTTYIVSRHPGAVEWVRQRLGAGECQVVAHLDHCRFQPGDRVCGVLPIQLAAQICAAGAQVHVICLDVPPELRSKELSAQQLDELGARLIRYHVVEAAPESSTPAGHPTASPWAAQLPSAKE